MLAETTMHTTADQLTQQEICYHGLRMTAEEYFQLGETHQRYELIDGVVCMSPSPTRVHQDVMMEIAHQLRTYVISHAKGKVYSEIDVRLGKGPDGRDLVYRPDVVFITNEHAERCGDPIDGAPALAVEVVSPSSRRFDKETKKGDYERCGVSEYWIVDPQTDELIFYCLEDGKYVQQPVSGQDYASRVIEGFTLDLQAVRGLFKG